MIPNSQSKVLKWLRSGKAWAQKPHIVETHAALVFLVGGHAYKLKKAVDLGYLDFSTIERRHEALDRELALNRRTAPNLYLRVLPIMEHDDGSLSLGGAGNAVDWLLEMRRFADTALLSAIADRHALDESVVERLAEHIAAFHDGVAPIQDYDWAAAVARVVSENFSDLRAQKNALGEDLVDAAIAAAEGALARAGAALAVEASDIRHCHGDLHLANAFVEDGKPMLFDCIEFDDFYAVISPLYDLSFLLMDLVARDLTPLANRALNSWVMGRQSAHWREIMGALAALPLYLALRAQVRAKTLGRTPGAGDRARNYLRLAVTLSAPRPACLVAIGGISGTGKSSVGREVAWRLGAPPGAVHLRSDHIRKRMAGYPLAERLPATAYTAEASARVYAEMYDLAGLALSAGHAVVLDAVFAREVERDAARAVAQRTGAEFHGFWLSAPADVLERRIASRRNDASDADVAVLHKQLGYDLGRVSWHHIDAGGELHAVAAQVARRLGLLPAS